MKTDAGPCILVVEDDPGARGGIAEALRADGYAVATANDGAEGLACLRVRAAQCEAPQLILLDLVMPVSGWEFRARQLEDPRLAEIPVVVISGVYQPAPAAESMRAVAYLRKPIDMQLLLAVAARHCRRTADPCNPQASDAPASLAPPPAA